MLIASKAIIISKIRFRDNDLIVKCYTEKFGIKSYLVKNALKSKKGKFRVAYFQLLSILELQADHKDNRSLQYLKDIRLFHNYSSLHSNVVKSAIVMFLAEILDGILKEEEENKPLFQFLESSLIWFDENSANSNFHFIFLIELTKYLGFYPDFTFMDAGFFNLVEGKFQQRSTNNYCISGDNLKFLKLLLGIKFDVNKILEMSTHQKRAFLDMILLYFKLHLHGFKTPKSVTVLNQVFA
jgi:DNA repair protein RecO (recombination protein O)